MRIQSDRNVLFIGAHTDDIELFAGGLVSRLWREKTPQHWFTFSSHRGISDHIQASQEHIANARMAGVVEWNLLDYPACDGTFQSRRGDIYQTVLEEARRVKPQFVVTHPEDTNQDHQQLRAEVIRSLKGEVTIISGEYLFNDLGTSRKPDLYFPLEERDVEMKIAMVLRYESQQRPNRHYFDPDVWRGLARVRGAQVGCAYAEAFCVERMIVV